MMHGLQRVWIACAASLICVGSAKASLVAWWELDDADGSAAVHATVGSDGTYNNFNTGDWENAGSPGDASAPANSVNLDAVGAAHYLDLGSSGGPLNGLAHFTISMWVQMDSTSVDMTFLSVGQFTTGQPLVFWRDEDDSLGGGTNNNTIAALVGNARVSGSNNVLANTGWHHVALTFAPNLSTGLQLYVDGVNVTAHRSGTTASSFSTITTKVLRAGQVSDAVSASKQFDGHMDEIAIYDETLNAHAISVLAGGAAATAVIPEPTSMMLLGLGSLVLMRRSRMRVA
ncbi:MAG: PEP-CTERM sorting domain-containing protein [Planctomycetes bacterium]|nr:PEP-CTERM sorting domain-containing protein [Planctomycetota bacterium]